MTSQGRGIPRPRPALNCRSCKQRKVRCSKERPACTNCVRVKAACEYENTVSDRVGNTVLSAKRTVAFEEESTPSSKREKLSLLAKPHGPQSIDLVPRARDLDNLNGTGHLQPKPDPSSQILNLNSSSLVGKQQSEDGNVSGNVAHDAIRTVPSNSRESTPITHGYLSKQLGGQFSYVENSFWALIRGYVSYKFDNKNFFNIACE